MKQLKKIIEELTNLQGNCGYEDDVIDYVAKVIQPFSSNISVDSIGNVTVHFTPDQPHKNCKKIMLFGHLDEVGMMIRQIDENGFIMVEKLGSINPISLNGAKVQLAGEKGTIDGVIGVKSHHLAGANDKKAAVSAQSIFIDIGAKDKNSVLNAGVDVGTPIVIKPQFISLLNNCIANKAMDDRALLAILIYLCQTLDRAQLECDLYIVFSVQEEFNTRGIMPAVRAIQPDIVLGMDVTPATDTPDLKDFSNIHLGGGPALTYMNHHSRGTLAGLIPNKKFLQYLETIAVKEQIPLQKEVATGILTETAYIAIEKSDTIVANISLPTRYTHTAAEVICLDDVLNVYQLVKAFLYDINANTSFGKNYDWERRHKNR